LRRILHLGAPRPATLNLGTEPAAQAPNSRS
jgi:hypothetical protein